MKIALSRAAISVSIAAALLGACADNIVAPNAPRDIAPSSARAAQLPLPSVRFAEIHYDNAGTDVNERIEVSFPTGTNLTGWNIVLYNGTGGASYDTKSLVGPVAPSCGAGSNRSVVVLSYPSNGIQNGSPDGMALVDPNGAVVEFLSYEGTFVATNGPANGMTSVDILASEAGTEGGLNSLARSSSDFWTSGLESFGVCNDNGPIVAGPIANVTVTPTPATILINGTQQFTASATDANGTPVPGATFTWSSSNTAAATINASGLATGVAAGVTTITATSTNNVLGTASLTVNVQTPVPSNVHISEIHYDNVGTDAGESIEVEGPAGTSLAGWSVVLYNGNGGVTYNTQALSGTIPASCGANGVVVINYPSNGIQNGSPDGMALVSPAGVVEFLSYEGTFAATNGPANGMTSTNIGVSEDPDNSVPAGQSLQRASNGTWNGPLTSTLGACNPAPPPPTAPIVINELMADPVKATGGASFGEWFEVKNTGAAPIDLQGWTIASTGQPDHVIATSVVVPAGGYAVLGRSNDATRNGGVTVNYSYFTGSTTTTIFLDGTDILILRDGAGATVDSVRWTTSSTMVSGVTRALKDATTNNANVDGSNWGYSTTNFGNGDFGTPGAANAPVADVPPVIPNTITFSGRLPSDPPLPPGFEDQIFGTLHNGGPSGPVISTTITWTSETPTIASIDLNGVIHSIADGTATFRATATDGTTGTFSLPMLTATLSATALYGNNTEFGDPKDADPSDDFIIRRNQFTTSYNKNRSTPNWVAYNLDPTHFGSAVDRCDCFTMDPALPAATFTHINTNDYTGAGTFAGYGIDRGHLARSFDRTAGNLDNAYTFLFSNIIPQASDLNQGPWAQMENAVGDFARNQGKEVYVVAGVAGNKGSVKGEGKITIPTSVWKVVVIMPHDQGLANVHTYADLQVIAVIMPNDPGVRSVDWHTYETTVDAVEALSGYDLLSLLPDKIEAAVESNTKPPIAALNGPYTGAEGSAVNMSASASVDLNGTITSYAWTFGDGSNGTGVTASHPYAQDGNYTVTLTVTDNDGLTDVVTSTVSVNNVAPVVGAIGGASLLVGETYTASGAFTDPGADTWSATVNYGDGSATSALSLTGKTFSLSHKYTTAGTFTVTVRVSDDDGTTTKTSTVTVGTPSQGIAAISAMIDQMVTGGKVSKGNANSLTSKLDAALKQIEKENFAAARNQLGAFINEVDAMEGSGRLSAADAAALRAEANRVIASIT